MFRPRKPRSPRKNPGRKISVVFVVCEVKPAVAPVCRFLLWGRVSIPPRLKKRHTGRKTAENTGVGLPEGRRCKASTTIHMRFSASPVVRSDTTPNAFAAPDPASKAGGLSGLIARGLRKLGDASFPLLEEAASHPASRRTQENWAVAQTHLRCKMQRYFAQKRTTSFLRTRCRNKGGGQFPPPGPHRPAMPGEFPYGHKDFSKVLFILPVGVDFAPRLTQRRLKTRFT